MKHVFEVLNKIKSQLRKGLIADELEPSIARKKHIRLGLLIIIIFLLIVYLVFAKGEETRVIKAAENKSDLSLTETSKKIDIANLTQGTTSEIHQETRYLTTELFE